MTTVALPTQVNIVNLALGHLKQRQITSMSDGSVQASAANRCYETARRETLRGHDWEFATVIEELVSPADASDWVTSTAYIVGDFVNVSDVIYRCATAHTSGTFATDLAAVKWVEYTPFSLENWSYSYAYPVNALAVWHVYNDATANKTNGDDFRVLYDSVNNLKIIVSNTDTAYAEYTYDLSDTTLFDSTFVTAFAYRLAADMAPILTGDDSLADTMLKKAMVAISEAERYSAYENTQVKETPTSVYEDAR